MGRVRWVVRTLYRVCWCDFCEEEGGETRDKESSSSYSVTSPWLVSRHLSPSCLSEFPDAASSSPPLLPPLPLGPWCMETKEWGRKKRSHHLPPPPTMYIFSLSFFLAPPLFQGASEKKLDYVLEPVVIPPPSHPYLLRQPALKLFVCLSL